ncbi:MAG: TonB-dependent receptor [Bacteroidales bacterium]|nr:TonB-dependent receptor [Bacteroidales bacterium]
MKILLAILIPLLQEIPNDTIIDIIDTVSVSATIKSSTALDNQALATTSFKLSEIENQQINSVKDVSVSVPNFFQPKYGSRITSSIYIRGFGSRIDQPAMGLNIDNIPVMNKNAFDFDFFDIRRIDVLRGPQGTLYGRNSNGGIMNIYTLSPLAWQGLRVRAEFDSEPSYKAQVSFYEKTKNNFGYAVSAAFTHHDGFFTNTYNDAQCDKGNSFSARTKFHWLPNDSHWNLSNSLSFNYVNEGGYAYHVFDNVQNELKAISYNDTCNYKRVSLIDGLVAQYSGKKIDIASATSFQFLHDKMLLDNDFTALSYFTLKQEQTEYAVTQEVIFKRHDKTKQWQWSTGLFAFTKQLAMETPVKFKRDGIDNLILANANKGIHSAFPTNNIEISDSSFVIDCNFQIPTYGVALFHESQWNIGRWRFTAGIRADFEYATMDYDEQCDIRYRFDLTMLNFKQLHSDFTGTEHTKSFVALPKISVQYNFDKGNLYATFANGHKAGGFNTQIFSDIMQSVMMTQMMSDLGVSFAGKSGKTQTARDTKYEPETNYNFEIGGKFHYKTFSTATTLFWIEGVNQQITVMPEGSGIGRMMSNAGRTRSIGVEHSSRFEPGDWSFSLDAGCTDARFRDYQYNDTTNYRDKHVPYAPTGTVAVSAKYTWQLNKQLIDNLSFVVQNQTVGIIYWNEDNSLSQSPYSLLSASVTYKKNKVSISIFSKNITNTNYRTFYFKSISRMFYSEGIPRTVGMKLMLNV